MNPRVACALLLLAGCGSDPPTIAELTLASSYDVIGVKRDFPDGLTVTAQTPITLTLENVAASGGNVRAEIVTGSSSAAVAISGTFDSDSGRVLFDPTSGAVWSGRVDVIDGVGGTALDASPRDGIANEIVGFIQTSTGTAQFETSLLAVARTDARPESIVATKVTITVPELGVVNIVGEASSAPRSGGIEIFRHQLIERDPEFALFQARDDGSFDVTLSGFSKDLFLIRPRVAGRAGTGIALFAP